MLDSLVRVSRRVEWDPTFYSLLWAPTVSRRDRSRPEGPTDDAAQVKGRNPWQANTRPVCRPSSRSQSPTRVATLSSKAELQPRWAVLRRSRTKPPPPSYPENHAVRPSRAHSFNPLNGFTHYWTPTSRFFSTFPRGTCSLSVSWRYLALEGVYLPLRAALSSNPTLGKGPMHGRG